MSLMPLRLCTCILYINLNIQWIRSNCLKSMIYTAHMKIWDMRCCNCKESHRSQLQSDKNQLQCLRICWHGLNNKMFNRSQHFDSQQMVGKSLWGDMCSRQVIRTSANVICSLISNIWVTNNWWDMFSNFCTDCYFLHCESECWV